MAVAVNSILRGIIEDMEDDVELNRACADMKDPYYQGYVDALEYAANEIVGARLKEGTDNAD